MKKLEDFLPFKVDIVQYVQVSDVRRNLSWEGENLQVKNTITESNPGHGPKTFPSLQFREKNDL